jgi:hypothetical protein
LAPASLAAEFFAERGNAVAVSGAKNWSGKPDRHTKCGVSAKNINILFVPFVVELRIAGTSSALLV